MEDMRSVVPRAAVGRRGKWALLSGMVGVILLVAGCGASAPSKGPSAGHKYTIEYIEQNTGNPYFDDIAAGMKTVASKLGFKLVVTGPAAATASSQIPFIQNAVVSHVSAIAIQPNDPSAPLPALRQAKAHHILVLSTNIASIPSVSIGSVTGFNYDLVAGDQMAELGQIMHYQGDFAILSATTTAPFQVMVVAQEEKILATDPRYKNMHEVKVAYGNDVPATATQQSQALLTEFPNLKAITSPTTVGIASAAGAVVSAGDVGKVLVTGLCDPQEIAKYIDDGAVPSCQLWNPTDIGIASAYVLWDALHGQKLVTGGTVTVPGLGTLKVGVGKDVYAQNAMTTFTKANIAEYHF